MSSDPRDTRFWPISVTVTHPGSDLAETLRLHEIAAGSRDSVRTPMRNRLKRFASRARAPLSPGPRRIPFSGVHSGDLQGLSLPAGFAGLPTQKDAQDALPQPVATPGRLREHLTKAPAPGG